jgi:hypothetical protein
LSSTATPITKPAAKPAAALSSQPNQITAASPSKKLTSKRKRAKKVRQPKWKLVPWSERGTQKGPLFARLVWELLQRPRSDFGKDEHGEWSKFMLRPDMTASEFVSIRLITSAMSGDLAATRQLIDLIDSAKAVEVAKAAAGPMVVMIEYLPPVERQSGQAKAAYQKTLSRAERMIDVAQVDGQITYEPIEPGTAE